MSKESLISEWDKSNASIPKPGTLEDLFKDYDDGSCEAEIVDLGEPVGKEKW